MIFLAIFIILFIVLFSLQIFQEIKLIKIFEDNNLLIENTELQQADNPLSNFEILLINFDFLPSFKGEYSSVLFENKFNLELYADFDLLTLNTYHSSYSIKLPKTASSVKNDIFAGKLLKIQIPEHSLVFKLPNEMQKIYSKH